MKFGDISIEEFEKRNNVKFNEEEKKAIGNLKIIAEYIGENYFFGKQGIENLKKDINVTLNYLNHLQKELDKEKEKNKKLNLENQALFENINCNDDNMLARRYQKLQKELDKKDKVIDSILDEVMQLYEIIRDKRCKKSYADSKEHLKEYYYKKVEKENE